MDPGALNSTPYNCFSKSISALSSPGTSFRELIFTVFLPTISIRIFTFLTKLYASFTSSSQESGLYSDGLFKKCSKPNTGDALDGYLNVYVNVTIITM